MDEPPLPGADLPALAIIMLPGTDLLTLAVLFILVLLSAFFSATETAFSSMNRIRVKNMAENGSKRAALVLKLHDRYDGLLSTILIGNNIVNLSAASISTAFFIRRIDNIGVMGSTVILTAVLLLFGEITPKSLAKESPERFALFSAPVVQCLVYILAPVNLLFALWKKLLNLFVKVTPGDKAITEQELLIMVGEAEQEGTIDEEDKQLIHTAFEFNDLIAGDILTPLANVSSMPKGISAAAAAALFMDTGYSRLPVYEGSVNNIIGVVHLRDFFSCVWKREQPLETVITPAVFVAASVKINDLLKLLQNEKSHMAVVTDEQGRTAGLVTMEDILEELVGEIWDENDEIGD